MTHLPAGLTEAQLQHMMDNSFTNFHVKGFDYLCLKRSPHVTDKIYFFEGDVAHLPEVVNPHDHRYNFKTTVLTGAMSDSTYKVVSGGPTAAPVFYEHEWRTPLNGGDGAEYLREVHLREQKRVHLESGAVLGTHHQSIHTIRMHSDTCVIRLEQYEDVVPFDAPTRLYRQDKQTLNIDGLYEKPTADHCIKRYQQYLELSGRLGG